MSAKNIHIDNIGLVAFVKNKRSTRIRVTVKPEGVKVSMPDWGTYREAIKFTESNTNWIQQQQSKLAAGLIKFGPESCFKTKFHKIKIVKGNYKKVSNRLGDGKLQFFIPENLDHTNNDIQKFIKDSVVQLMRIEAKTYLPQRVDELAKKYNLHYKNVVVKNVKTRWGSCSFDNNINLNIHLMRLPNHLIDYVILHELAHTIEKNHSERFWNLLDKLMQGDSKIYRKEMKKYSTTVF